MVGRATMSWHMTVPKELDVVKNLVALPAEGIAAGSIGVVLEVFTSPSQAYLVEFANSEGETVAMPTLTADQICLEAPF